VAVYKEHGHNNLFWSSSILFYHISGNILIDQALIGHEDAV